MSKIEYLRKPRENKGDINKDFKASGTNRENMKHNPMQTPINIQDHNRGLSASVSITRQSSSFQQKCGAIKTQEYKMIQLIWDSDGEFLSFLKYLFIWLH